VRIGLSGGGVPVDRHHADRDGRSRDDGRYGHGRLRRRESGESLARPSKQVGEGAEEGEGAQSATVPTGHGVGLEPPGDGSPRAEEQHLDRRARDPELGCDLVVGKSAPFPQEERAPLVRRQRSNRRGQLGELADGR
jgi:hypothetical protein